MSCKDTVDRNVSKPVSEGNKVVHLSIDDVDAFLDLVKYQDEYQSIYDHQLFNYLRHLHDEYGAVFSLYVYQHSADHSLSISDVPRKFKTDFMNAKCWLRIGFHAIDIHENIPTTVNEFKNAYDEVNTAIGNFADSSMIAHTVRLSHFYSPDSILSQLRGVCTLLCADSPSRSSYDLNPRQIENLYSHGLVCNSNRSYLVSDLRTEHQSLPLIISKLNRLTYRDTLVIFTHQWAISPQSGISFIKKQLKQAVRKSYTVGMQPNSLNRLNLEVVIKLLKIHNYHFSFLDD